MFDAKDIEVELGEGFSRIYRASWHRYAEAYIVLMESKL
jgi:hypothetical protein